MNEIKCPKCGYEFKIDEHDYESILKQVRDKEFEKDLLKEKEYLENNKDSEIKILENELEKKYTDIINNKDKELLELNNKLQNSINDKDNAIKLALVDNEKKYNEEINNNKLLISNLKNEIDKNNNEYLLKEKNIIDNYNEKLKSKDEQIAYYKDFKAKESTKMIGESLEQHCYNEFNKVRPIFSEKTYFEKDNDIKTGSKGDFIFRDYDNDGTEIVSIMFEMKNEADETSSKHKNEDFLKELDKDRKEKNCEYAVLVSLLEIDNDLYNTGIVDYSHKYEKMYVIRPQFFIPIITLIRNASLNALKYKKEIDTLHNQNIDIANFENNILGFKDAFSRNYRIASEKFSKAIEEIDKTIDHLQKTKDALISSENQLRLANNKADDLSIKKLTNNCPSVAKMFDELNKD